MDMDGSYRFTNLALEEEEDDASDIFMGGGSSFLSIDS
jgi:hypothetical protein